MIYTEHKDVEGFLSVVRSTLELNESANGLMLGICLRLARDPNTYGHQAYMGTIESTQGLRLAALMTPPYKLQLYSEDDQDSIGFERLIDELLRGGWTVPGVLGRETAGKMFASIWCSRQRCSFREGMRQRIHELRRVVHPVHPSGEFRPADIKDIELARSWAYGFHDECFDDNMHGQTVSTVEDMVKRGEIFFWVDGAPRSMAGMLRPTPNGQAVSYVFTPKEDRSKGYASAVVACLSQRILDNGKKFCTLYTDLSNPTSNSIYRKVGYKGVADVIDIFFESKLNNNEIESIS